MKKINYLSSIILSLVLMLITINLSAWSITDFELGNRFPTTDARAMAMGNATAYNDLRPFSINSNPGNLTLQKNTYGFQISGVAVRNEAERFVPFWNFFDNYLDDNAISSNIDAYDNYSGIMYYNLKTDYAKFGVALYTRPMLSFDGKYSEEVRDNRNSNDDFYPTLFAMNSINNEGILRQSGGVVGFRYYFFSDTSINIGIDASQLKGDANQEWSIKWTDSARNLVPSLPDSLFKYTSDLSGKQYKLGTDIQFNKRLGIGVSFTPKTTLDRTGTADKFMGVTLAKVDSLVIDEDFILPMEIRAGFCYEPRNIMRTRFNLDLEYVKWTDICDAFEDTYNFYVGVEHALENKFPFRIGFQSNTSWQVYSENVVIDNVTTPVKYAKKIITPTISFGTGCKLSKNVALDVGFSYMWREYEALDLFRDNYYNYTNLWSNTHIHLADRGWENPDKVKENFISLASSISFAW